MFSEYVRQYYISRITPHWSEIRDWSYRIEKLEKENEQLREFLEKLYKEERLLGWELQEALGGE